LSLHEQQKHFTELQKFSMIDMLSFDHHCPPKFIVHDHSDELPRWRGYRGKWKKSIYLVDGGLFAAAELA
jgi:hypothetical protein